MIDAPQPTQPQTPPHSPLTGPPRPPGTPVSTTPAEQAPLSRGRERRSGDCPATAATSVGAHIVRRATLLRQNPAGNPQPHPTPEQAPCQRGWPRRKPRTGGLPRHYRHPRRPRGRPTAGDNPSDLAALGHLPLAREAGAPATPVGAHIVRPGNPAAAQTPAGGINPAPTGNDDRPRTRPTPATAKRGKRRGKGDPTPPTPADIIKLRRRAVRTRPTSSASSPNLWR